MNISLKNFELINDEWQCMEHLQRDKSELKDSREMKMIDIAGGDWFHIYGKTNVSMRVTSRNFLKRHDW